MKRENINAFISQNCQVKILHLGKDFLDAFTFDQHCMCILATGGEVGEAIIVCI